MCDRATAPTVAAPSSSSSQPPLPPLMERVRKIKRQLSMTLRGGNSGDKNMTESISSQDTGAHSDSGTAPHPHLHNPHPQVIITLILVLHFQPSTRHVLIHSKSHHGPTKRNSQRFTISSISKQRACVHVFCEKSLHVTGSKFRGFIF